MQRQVCSAFPELSEILTHPQGVKQRIRRKTWCGESALSFRDWEIKSGILGLGDNSVYKVLALNIRSFGVGKRLSGCGGTLVTPAL